MNSPQLNAYLLAFVLFIVLPLLSRPRTWRVLAWLAAPVNEWMTAHARRAEERDRDDDDVWLMYRRDKLCTDLRRIEHLLATDMWMSATRQLGNRLAYRQLVDELSHTPDVYPAGFGLQTFDPWEESTTESRSGALLTGMGYSEKPRTVEILDIGWGRRRR